MGDKVLSGLAAVVVTLAISSVLMAKTPPDSMATAIEAAVQHFAKSTNVASITARVTQNGVEVYSGSIGMADIEQHVPATPHTLYAIGSISKSYTAYCILALASERRLSLDTPVGSILPEIKGPPAQVTIRQLLVHIGGIPDYEPMVAKDEARTYSTQEVLNVFNDKPLEFTPGTIFAYSNSDHYLLGMVIERVTGMTYAQALERMIFKPFGLAHTAYGERAPIIEWRARGYGLDKDKRLINAAPWHETVPFAAGGLVSTTADLDHFTEQLVAGAGVGALEHAFEKVKLSNGTQLSYLPISLAEGRFHGKPYYWHAGGIDGFLSFAAILPSEHLTFSMFINTFDAGVSSYALYHRVVRIALELPVEEHEVPLSAPQAKEFSGRYALYVLSSVDGGHLMNRSFLAEFVFENGRLVRKPDVGNGAAKPLNYVGHGRFVSPDDPDQIYAFTNIRGKTRLTIDDITPWGGERLE